MGPLDLDSVNRFVLHKQHLTEDSKAVDIVRIAADIAGLHATGPTTPYLSLFARCRNFERTSLDEELYALRSIGRIRCMRKTIYMLPREMLPFAHQATAAMVQRASSRHMEFRGVTLAEYGRVSRTILSLVRDGGMTASAIKKALQTDLHVSAILYLMCDQGLLARGRPVGGWKDQQYRYFPFSEYFPAVELGSVSEPEAITTLVRQYLASFGPATENDLVWWTGLGKRKVRSAMKRIHPQIVQVRISGIKGEFIMLRSDQERLESTRPPQEPTANLLPSLDPYLMGYKDRERYLDQAYYDRVFDRSGNATSSILLDGRVIGVWDVKEAKAPLVKLHTFKPVGKDPRERILLEALRVGRFIVGGHVQIRECESMIPLTRRPAGSVMSPLKGC